MPVAPAEAIELLSAMVRIESVTPWLIPTGSGETAIAQFIADWLDGTGAEIEIVDVEPGRPNVLARRRGHALPERAQRHGRVRELAGGGARAPADRGPAVRARRGRRQVRLRGQHAGAAVAGPVGRAAP